MDTATMLIVECNGENIVVSLGQPRTMSELWGMFYGCKEHPFLTMSGNVARATF